MLDYDMRRNLWILSLFIFVLYLGCLELYLLFLYR